MYEFCRDFESFYKIIGSSSYKPPKETVKKGIHFVMKKDGVPVSCCRVIPYYTKKGNFLFYFLGNVYTVDSARKGNNYGAQVCLWGIEQLKKDNKDVIVVGTVSSKTKEGRVLDRYYRHFGGYPASKEFIDFVEDQTGYVLEPDLQMMVVHYRGLTGG